MSAQTLQRAILRAATFLATVQSEDGGFRSQSSPTKTPFLPTRSYATTFVPATMLAALAQSDSSHLLPVRAQLAAWLLQQKSSVWSFNYWTKDSPERTTLPYPDDLDDTFCALLALHAHDPRMIDAAALGVIVKLLIATETTVGGPYRTWLVKPNAERQWLDVDVAVNANVAAFLARVAEPPQKLVNFLDAAIAGQQLRSPYYPSPLPIAYFLSREYRGTHKQQLIELLRNHKPANSLQMALVLSSLARLHSAEPDTALANILLASQNQDGSWAADAFCLDPSINRQPHYNGSTALTTALAIEALTLHYKARPRAARLQKSLPTDTPTRVMALAREQTEILDPILRTECQATLDRMAAKPFTAEIIQLPHLFAASLQQTPRLDQQLLDQFGAANVFGWMAYTIFDDFLDNQGKTKLLPVATFALRQCLALFRQAAPHHTAFQQLVENTCNQIDAANAWELAHCRFAVDGTIITLDELPHFGQGRRLAERSLGHLLAPIGVLAAADYPIHSESVRAIIKAFKHYLIARQLCDDMHDWEADLKQGHITYVVAALLREQQLPTKTCDLTTLLPAMQREFWHKQSPKIAATIARHNQQARLQAANSQLLTTNNVFQHLTTTLDDLMAKTHHERAEALAFLAAYRKAAL